MEAVKQEIQVEPTSNSGDEIRRLVHKLNNHLTLVIGYGQLLLLDDRDPEIRMDVTRIVDEARKASQIAKDLFSFAGSKGVVS